MNEFQYKNYYSKQNIKTIKFTTLQTIIHWPADDEKLALGGVRPELAPEVHGEERGGGVVDGGEGRHDGRQHHCHQQATQA